MNIPSKRLPKDGTIQPENWTVDEGGKAESKYKISKER